MDLQRKVVKLIVLTQSYAADDVIVFADWLTVLPV